MLTILAISLLVINPFTGGGGGCLRKVERGGVVLITRKGEEGTKCDSEVTSHKARTWPLGL